MKHNSLTTLFALALLATACSRGTQMPSYPISNVPFTSVKADEDSFWGERIRQSREVTIPLAFAKCEESDRYTNFENAAARMRESAEGADTSNYLPTAFPFDDTDVYKTIEGASFLLQTYPDKELENYIDSVLNIVAAAQESDGYLYTARTMNPKHPHAWSGASRWVAEESGSHELYNLGHMVEAAIAHYQATGSRKFLDIAIRYADCVCREIGYGEGRKVIVPGHQIAEMALAKLYLVTGEEKYLQEARMFLDNKGKTQRKDEYDQSHLPVVQQDEAVGHSVRAGYMYAGMADVAALTGDNSYIEAIENIWNNMVGKKMYLTGGIGSNPRNEGFSANYDLPNMNGYCETCAAIANVYVNHRMFLMQGKSEYIDVLERALYNGVISGVSLDGGEFFYPNPLESHGQHNRQPWFGCACCPSNICRFIPSVPGYAYATKGNSLYINLFFSNTLSTEVAGRTFAMKVETLYPEDGDIRFTVEKAPAKELALRIRIPGWVRGKVLPSDLYSYCDGLKPDVCIKVNDITETSDIEASLVDGYYVMERRWKTGDVVEVHFDMPVRTVKANEAVVEDRGKVAVERGPLVYCAEWPDNSGDVLKTAFGQNRDFSVNDMDMEVKGRLYGMKVIDSESLRLIPYYAWAHRGSGNMTVWINE